MTLEMNANGSERGANFINSLRAIDNCLTVRYMKPQISEKIISFERRRREEYIMWSNNISTVLQPEKNWLWNDYSSPELQSSRQIGERTNSELNGSRFRSPSSWNADIDPEIIPSRWNELSAESNECRPLTLSFADDDFDLKHEAEMVFEEALKLNDMLESRPPTHLYGNADIDNEFNGRRQSKENKDAVYKRIERGAQSSLLRPEPFPNRNVYNRFTNQLRRLHEKRKDAVQREIQRDDLCPVLQPTNTPKHIVYSRCWFQELESSRQIGKRNNSELNKSRPPTHLYGNADIDAEFNGRRQSKENKDAVYKRIERGAQSSLLRPAPFPNRNVYNRITLISSRGIEVSADFESNECRPLTPSCADDDFDLETLDDSGIFVYERRTIRESDNVIHKTIESNCRPLTPSFLDDEYFLNQLKHHAMPVHMPISFERSPIRVSDKNMYPTMESNSLKRSESERNVKGSKTIAKFVSTLTKKIQNLEQRNILKFCFDMELTECQTARNVRNSIHLKRKQSNLNKLQKHESKTYLSEHKKLKEETPGIEMAWFVEFVCMVKGFLELPFPKKWKDQFEKVHEDEKTDATVANKRHDRATEIGQVSLQGGSDGKKRNQRRDMPPKSSGHVHNSTEAEFDSHDPKIEEEIRKLEQLLMCKVCLDKDSCIVFFPCRHMATCESCEIYLKRCPVCRASIGEAVKINEN